MVILVTIGLQWLHYTAHNVTIVTMIRVTRCLDLRAYYLSNALRGAKKALDCGFVGLFASSRWSLCRVALALFWGSRCSFRWFGVRVSVFLGLLLRGSGWVGLPPSAPLFYSFSPMYH
jgi:hypothetical protein